MQLQRSNLIYISSIICIIGLGLWWKNHQSSFSFDQKLDAVSGKKTEIPVGMAISPQVITRFEIQKYPSEVQKKITILDQIFETKNDNDPRLDSEFLRPSDETKQALMDKYMSLPMESRNERGTILFLMGRNLSNAKDLDFYQNVLRERPCMGLAHCDAADHTGEHEDHDGSTDITLAYPQLVLLSQLELFLANPSTSLEMREKAAKIIIEGTESQVSRVRSKSFALKEKYLDGEKK
jgi:hypothetical protein